MFNQTISMFSNAYRGLSPSAWWLSLVMLINRSGTMVLPFMTIYLTSDEMGYSIGKAGIVMALFGIGSIAGGLLGGRLTDKIGFYNVQLGALALGGLLFIILGQMRSFPMICVFTFLLSMINESFRPANSSAIVAYSKPENRTRSYALNRLAINLGWAAGNTIGGFLAAYNYELLFWVDGCTNIMAAVLLWYNLGPKKVKRPERSIVVADPKQSVYRDKTFIWFLILTAIYATCFFQLLFNLNPYYSIELNFSKQFIGINGAVNGILIACVEMVVIYKLEGRRSPMSYIIMGVFLTGFAFAMLNIFHINYFMALVMMVVVTVGEILAMPFMNTYWISRSADHNRGQYAGLYTISWGIAQTAAPLFGAQIADFWGFDVLWWITGGLCMLCGLGFYVLGKRQ